MGMTVAGLYTYAAAQQPKAAKTKAQIGNPEKSNAALLFRRGFQQLTPENKHLAVEFVKLLNRTQGGR